jgi:hypothetical protein
MGEVDLQEHRHNKKGSCRLKHNTRNESVSACCFHHLFVLEVFDLTTLSIRAS